MIKVILIREDGMSCYDCEWSNDQEFSTIVDEVQAHMIEGLVFIKTMLHGTSATETPFKSSPSWDVKGRTPE